MIFCAVRCVRRQTAGPGQVIRVTLLALGLVLTAATTSAQTLGQAVEQAWARHSQAAALTARESEAQARAEVAAGLTPSPPSMALSHLSDRLNANQGKQEWELELALPLWLPGQRAARVHEADRARAELNSRRAALRLQVAGEVRELWWQLALVRHALNLATRREAAAVALADDVARRYQAGELARLDANLAHNERLAAQGELLEARAALRQAEQGYRVLTGAEAPAELNEESRSTLAELSPAHPQWMAAQAAAEVAQARLGVTQQTRREAPELALRLVRERGDFAESYANVVGVKLSVPFASDARGRQDTAAALAEFSQAEAELTQIQQRLAQEAAQARWALETAQEQLAHARARHELTADNLRLAEKSFAMGESDLSTLLRARASALDAQAYLNRQQVAQAAGVSRLNQNLGVMP